MSATFKAEQVVYEAERIDVSGVLFDDNVGVVELIDNRRTGLVGALDEACTFPRATDGTFMAKVVTVHKRDPLFVKPTVGLGPAGQEPGSALSALSASFDSASSSGSPNRPGAGPSTTDAAGLLFGIRHTGGTVLYSAAGFLSASKERVDGELCALLATSGIPLIRSLFDTPITRPVMNGNYDGADGNHNIAADPGNAHLFSAFAPSVPVDANLPTASRFVAETSRMLAPLALVTPHFVRCLKPNARLQPQYVDPLLLHSQVCRNRL